MKEILFLEPVFKEVIWGGNKLSTSYGYKIPSNTTGECWAVSAHKNGDCKLKSGKFKGKSLSWLWDNHREIFGNAKTWEDFIKMFTNNEYIAQSKYIREVIMGNCNCGRHITYEKHIMDGILTGIIDSGVDRKNVVFFSNDEIVLDITDANYDEQVATALIESPVPLRADYFTLRAIKDINNNGKILGYIREMLNGTYDFKCFNHYNLPFVLRFLNGETPTDNDTVFEYEGNLSKLIKIPTLELI